MTDRVTIRLVEGKEDVYEQFKEVVTEKLHSDVCYVMTELMEVFTTAVNQLPATSPVILRFLKQNVQINMGCSFNYNTRKAKRLPPDRKILEVQKNQILPNLIDMWDKLKPESQRYWLQVFKEAGIFPESKPRRRRPASQPADICHTHHHKKWRKFVKKFRKFQRKLRGVAKWVGIRKAKSQKRGG